MESVFHQQAFSGLAHSLFAGGFSYLSCYSAEMSRPLMSLSSQTMANRAFTIRLMLPFCLETLGTAAFPMVLSGLAAAVGTRAHKGMVAVQGPANITNAAFVMLAAIFCLERLTAPGTAGITGEGPDGL